MIPEKYQLAEKTASSLVEQLLLNRDISDEEKKSFLEKKYSNLHDPLLLKDIEKGAERVFRAINKKEKIVIYADYDADGIPSAVMLHNLFEKIGYKNCEVYIPHRHDEGYGIHLDAMNKIIGKGAGLIIAVDVGTTDFDAIELANENDIDVIVIDHHTPLVDNKGRQKEPNAYAFINPKREGDQYPEKMLCAAGVVYKFVQFFVKKYSKEYDVKNGWEKWLLDMVGIATISDMVPLLGENRLLAHFGLVVTRKTKNIGLKKLLEQVGAMHGAMTEDDIAFSVSPKINAASRMSHPEEAFKLLIAKTELQAKTMCDHLISLNTERKLRVAQIMREVRKKLRGRKIEKSLVIGDPNWSLGVLGLVAGKLSEELNVPVFVWSEENKQIKGSCRTANGINLVELMESLPEDTFIQFGGHKEAGGFTCEKKNIHDLEEKLNTALKSEKINKKDERTLIDMKLSLDEVNLDTYKDIRQLAPFGMKNPKPIFLFENVLVESIREFGKGREHLEISFKNGVERIIKAIAFFTKIEDFNCEIAKGSLVNMIANIEYSVFRNRGEVRLRIVDIFCD